MFTLMGGLYTQQTQYALPIKFGLKLINCLRHRPNIEPTLGEHLWFAGYRLMTTNNHCSVYVIAIGILQRKFITYTVYMSINSQLSE